MNFARLARRFPELAQLPAEEQAARVKAAYDKVFAPEHKLTHWRANAISAIAMTLFCLGFVVYIAPLLGLSQPASAGIVVIVVFPVYVFLQQRRVQNMIRAALMASET